MKRLYIMIGWWIFLINVVFSSTDVYSKPVEQNAIYHIIQYPDEDDDLYSQIPLRDLPEAIKEAIKEAYPEHTMEAAYIKVDGNYRIIIKTDEGRKSRVYYTPGGAFIRSAI